MSQDDDIIQEINQLISNREKEVALELCNEALLDDPDNLDLYLARARVLRRFDRLSDAIADYNRYIEARGDDVYIAEIYRERIWAYYHSGQLHKAIEDATYLIERFPEHPYHYKTRASVYMESNAELSIADYEKYIELNNDPRDKIKVFLMCAHLCQDHGAHDQAIMY